MVTARMIPSVGVVVLIGVVIVVVDVSGVWADD